uniref:Uncharacterized protein n=1 Tax=viral metagenome TaxID=1070528 RepID=A0A6C0DVM8_9ZZZZ
MSLPAALTSQALTAITAISPLENFLQIFNTNPYFIGLMMLILNLGGRFISLEVTKKQEQFLQLPWVRRVLIFTVLFVATRNIWVAFWATVTVVLFLGYLFNENSALCIFGDGGRSGSKCSDAPKPGEEMTPEEKEILQRLSSKAQRYQTGGSGGKSTSKNPQQQALENSVGPPADEEDDVLHTDIYAANLTLLRNPQ